jgi:hypothetical protein
MTRKAFKQKECLACDAVFTATRTDKKFCSRICKGVYRRRYSKAKMRECWVKRNYGITLEQYDEMLAKQRGLCYICQQAPPEGKNLSVDHNHTTGEVRKLLCGNCNRGLGLFKERPELLLKAVEYLKEH